MELRLRDQRTRKLFFVLGLSLLAASAGAAEPARSKVALEDGTELMVAEIPYSRILPHAFHDQAVASIPAVYPGSKIIAARRFGQLGNEGGPFYALVCFKESSQREDVKVQGVVTKGMRAWDFSAEVTEASFATSLMLILEKIATLSFAEPVASADESAP